MSDQEPENNNLIKFIATTVETLRNQMATRSDVARLETKIEVEATTIRGDIEPGKPPARFYRPCPPECG